MGYPHEDIIDAIKKERKRQGLSQADLAERLGVPQPSIARIEARTVSPTLGILSRIADVLGMDVVLTKKEKVRRSVVLCLDMAGCPNRCRHCWLGDLPNGTLNDEDAEWAVSLFKQYFKDVTFYSWLREPDFLPSYRTRWEKDCALSSVRPERFELASFYRVVRDPDYVAFLKEVGVKKVQLTFFGGEESTDRYVGRKGAYQELLEATRVLLKSGIAPRWQFFINMENKDEILPQIKMGEALGVKEIFVHEGSCDGNNAKLYDIRIEKDAIPKELLPYYLDYQGIRPEGEWCQILKGSKECFLPHNEKDIVLYVTSDWNVYFNFTNPSHAWCLGNLKKDPMDRIVKAAVEECVPALVLSKAMPLGRLVSKYGDFESKKAFSLEDYKYFLLNAYLNEVYNLPKEMDDLASGIQKILKDSDW